MKSTPSSQLFLLLRPLLHVIGIVLVYRAILLLRGYTDLIPFVQLRIPVIDLHETLLFALLSASIFLVIGFTQHLYGLFRPTQQGYGTFVQTWVLWVMISGFVAWLGFGYIFVSGISRFILLVASGVSLVVLVIIDLVWSWLVAWRGHRFVYTLLVVSVDPSKAARIAEEFADHDAYLAIPCTVQGLASLETLRDGCVIVGTVDEHRLQARNEQCRLAGKDIYQLAEGHFFEHTFGVPMTVGPLVVTAWRSSPLTEWRRVVKRGFDIVVSFAALVIFSPLLGCVAIAIKLTSPGPVFYFQDRVGKQKQLFRFVKFRSMYIEDCIGESYGGSEAWGKRTDLMNSEKNIRKGILQKIADDPRVTSIGKILRKYSLDELPSLRCVLVGDMSLVGPRPHMPHEVAQYAEWHQRLFHVKPGITGYAQLYGRDKVPFDEEAKLDLWYIQHRSLWLDMFVLFATLKVIFGGK